MLVGIALYVNRREKAVDQPAIGSDHDREENTEHNDEICYISD